MNMTRRTLLASLPAAALAAAPGPVVGFAGGTYGMKSMKTDEALRSLAEIGYDGVELCLIAGWPADPARLSASEKRDLVKVVRGSGLAVPALLESLPVIGKPEKRAQNLERLRMATELAAELSPGKPAVIDTILGGKTSDWEKLKGPFAEELREWAKIAESSKVTVCFKPHAAHAIHNAERSKWLLKEVGSPRIRVIYDYSHFYVEGFELEASLKELLPWVAFISVKDARGTPEKHEYLLPGDGKTDYLEYFRILKRLKYSGWVGVEVSGMIHQKPGYEPVPTARTCYQRLAPLFDQAGLRRPARKGRG
jgi:sugar phosphate isomerase/epimerase